MTEQHIRITPINSWEERYGAPSIGAMRNIVFHANTNGFSKCIRRINGRVYIVDHMFFQCLDELNEQPRRKRRKAKSGIIERKG